MQRYFTALRYYGINTAGVDGTRPGEDRGSWNEYASPWGGSANFLPPGTDGL